MKFRMTLCAAAFALLPSLSIADEQKLLSAGIFLDQLKEHPAQAGYAFFIVWSANEPIDVGRLLYPKLGITVDDSRVSVHSRPYEARTSQGHPDIFADELKFYVSHGHYKFVIA